MESQRHSLETTAPRGDENPRSANPVSITTRPQNNRNSLNCSSPGVNPPRRNGRVDNDPESGSCHGKTEPPAPGEFRANCLRGIATVLASRGETSAGMKRIAASCVAWDRLGNSRSRAGQKGRGNLLLITLGASMEGTDLRKKPATDLPPDFGISLRVRKWAGENGFDKLETHLEYFVMKVEAHGYQYCNWDAAFMTAIRDDWAKIGQPKKNGNGSGPPWWTSNEGIQTKAAEMHIASRKGESWNDLKARVNEALEARH